MAQGAELPLSRCKWLYRERVVSMYDRRPMTRFTREILVKTLLLHTCYIFVALPTDDHTCKLDLFRNLPLYGGFAMQSWLYERGRQYEISEDQCPSDDDDKDNRQSPNLFRNSFEHTLYLLPRRCIQSKSPHRFARLGVV